MTEAELEIRFEWHERLELLFSDENYEKLGSLFEDVEEELDRFVNYLYKNNLFESLTQVLIEFPLTENDALRERGRSAREWYRLVILNGDIVQGTTSDYLITFFDNHHELLNIIRDLGECGIVSHVTIPYEKGRGVRIVFDVNSEHTEFTERLAPGTRNTFYHIEGYRLLRGIAYDDRIRSITGNWYMRIMRPMIKQGERPIPLEE